MLSKGCVPHRTDDLMGVLVCSLMQLDRGFSLDLSAFNLPPWPQFELRHFVPESAVQSTILLYGEAC
jgi:hypothetical protein